MHFKLEFTYDIDIDNDSITKSDEQNVSYDTMFEDDYYFDGYESDNEVTSTPILPSSTSSTSTTPQTTASSSGSTTTTSSGAVPKAWEKTDARHVILVRSDNDHDELTLSDAYTTMNTDIITAKNKLTTLTTQITTAETMLNKIDKAIGDNGTSGICQELTAAQTSLGILNQYVVTGYRNKPGLIQQCNTIQDRLNIVHAQIFFQKLYTKTYTEKAVDLINAATAFAFPAACYASVLFPVTTPFTVCAAATSALSLSYWIYSGIKRYNDINSHNTYARSLNAPEDLKFSNPRLTALGHRLYDFTAASCKVIGFAGATAGLFLLHKHCKQTSIANV